MDIFEGTSGILKAILFGENDSKTDKSKELFWKEKLKFKGTIV
jgi:hypothetical protein